MKLQTVRAPVKARPVNPADVRWIHAAQIMRSDAMTSLTNPEDDSELDVDCPLDAPCHVKIRQPDQVFENKASSFTLSQEARFVVSLVLETPAEAVDYLYSSFSGSVTRQKLLIYLRRRLGWPAERVRKVLYELSDYVENFER